MTPEIKKALDLALDRAVPSILSPGWVMIPDKDFDAIKQAIAAPTVQEPEFHGFMDEEECCVNICYTPWAPGGPNNELPTAYYTTPPAQPAPMPDALTDKDGEHPEYVQGWNDCRQAMRGNT